MRAIPDGQHSPGKLHRDVGAEKDERDGRLHKSLGLAHVHPTGTPLRSKLGVGRT